MTPTAPILPDGILFGKMGMIAWNIHVTGRQELADCAFPGSKLDAEQQEMV